MRWRLQAHLPPAELAVPPAIRVRDLTYTYPSAIPVRTGPAAAPESPVLRSISFDLHDGEFVALLGRVGAGKSTLCLALNGLVPQAAGGVFRGDVWVRGQNTKTTPVADLARSVGLVFQDPETQLTQMRVEDEVAFGPENLGLSRLEIGERVEWALQAVGLSAFRDRSPLHLSGGEKQRVAIAAVLAMRPTVLVLDEPTANLDPQGKAAVYGVLTRLATEQGITVLIATQDIERAARYAHRGLVLHDGALVAEGSLRRLFARPEAASLWGIGLPQMTELAGILGEKDPRAGALRTPAAMLAYLRRRSRPPTSASASPDHAAARGPADRAAPMPSGVTIARLEHVSFAYPDRPPALAGISLSLHRGELVALVGPNGSGKSTLARHLNGLARPTAGRVIVGGMDTRAVRVAQLARVAGYVFQNPDHQIFAPTVQEEIAFSLRLQGLPSLEVEQRTAGVLAEFGLELFAGLPPAVLGSGQRRRVALAAVLATRPQLLILDEPTGGLDRASRNEMMDRVETFRAHGGGVLLITHDMRLVLEHAERVLMLLQGRLAFDGPVGELFTRRDLLRRAGLSVPPVLRLAQRLWGDGAARSIRSARELAGAI